MPQSTDIFTSAGFAGQAGATGRFASPWVDMATQYAPRTFLDALKLCEYLYVNNATYRAASERVVAYFLTKISLQGQSDEEMAKFKKILDSKVNAMGALKAMGCDRMVYGNAFASIIPPFYRVLKCTECKSTAVRIENLPYGHLQQCCKPVFNSYCFSYRCLRVQMDLYKCPLFIGRRC